MSEPSWPTPEQVVAGLGAAGHLLEQQVATALEGHEFHVQTNRAFEDPDEGKSREIDVWAYRSFLRDEIRRLSVGCYLLVECKATAAPFAFLTRDVPPDGRNPEEFSASRSFHEKPFERDGRTLIRRLPTFDAMGLRDSYWGSTNPRAVYVTWLDRKGNEWRADNAGVFDSITYPLAKAQRAFKKPFQRSGRFDPSTDWVNVHLHLPVVVVPSRLFAVDGTTADPDAVEVPHIRFWRELRARGLEGHFGIDFVRRDALTDFVSGAVVPFCEALADRVSTDPSLVTPAHPRAAQ